MACRLGQSLVEDRNRKIVDLDLSEKKQRLGAPTPVRRLVAHHGCDRPCPRPFARHQVRTRRGKCPSASGLHGPLGRQPDSLFRQFGAERSCAALDREASGRIDRSCGSRVRHSLREREMSRPRERVQRHPGCKPVDDAAFLVEPAVGQRREQRVGEADRVTVALDDLTAQGGAKHVHRHARTPQHLLTRRTERGREGQRIAGLPWETCDAIADELVERSGNRQRLEWIEVATETPGKLEREKRVAACLLVHPEQRLPGKRVIETPRRKR